MSIFASLVLPLIDPELIALITCANYLSRVLFFIWEEKQFFFSLSCWSYFVFNFFSLNILLLSRSLIITLLSVSLACPVLFRSWRRKYFFDVFCWQKKKCQPARNSFAESSSGRKRWKFNGYKPGAWNLQNFSLWLVLIRCSRFD